MFIEHIITINAEIKKKLWNNSILNRLNVKIILYFCKMRVKSIFKLSHNLLKTLNNKFIQNLNRL